MLRYVATKLTLWLYNPTCELPTSEACTGHARTHVLRDEAVAPTLQGLTLVALGPCNGESLHILHYTGKPISLGTSCKQQRLWARPALSPDCALPPSHNGIALSAFGAKLHD